MQHRTTGTVFAAAAALALSACSQTGRVDSQGHAEAPAAEVVGKPVDCIQSSRIASTKVYDDYTIDFRMRGGATYRNTLPGRCPGLGFDQRFVHRTTIDQLCSLDTITVLQSGSSIPGPTCGLGKFVPITMAR